MTTQTLVTCNGKINQHGFCDKCYQPAHTTSNQCGRLVPCQQTGINMVLCEGCIPQDEIEKVLDQLLIARGEHPTRVRNPIYGEERELAKALLNHFIVLSPTVASEGWDKNA